MLHLSVGQWIVYGILAVFWAVLGYRLSENDRKRLGRTPWGLPSVVWAVFWFLSLLLGLVLYLIAHSGEVRRAQQNHTGVGDPASGPPTSMGTRPSLSRNPTAAEQFPAYPQPANLQVGAVPPQAAPSTDRSAPPDQELQGQPGDPDTRTGWPHSPPAWHPDPSGRFHFRWWDGYQWTSQVSTDGHHLIDTNPDQRIGPY